MGVLEKSPIGENWLNKKTTPSINVPFSSKVGTITQKSSIKTGNLKCSDLSGNEPKHISCVLPSHVKQLLIYEIDAYAKWGLGFQVKGAFKVNKF